VDEVLLDWCTTKLYREKKISLIYITEEALKLSNFKLYEIKSLNYIESINIIYELSGIKIDEPECALNNCIKASAGLPKILYAIATVINDIKRTYISQDMVCEQINKNKDNFIYQIQNRVDVKYLRTAYDRIPEECKKDINFPKDLFSKVHFISENCFISGTIFNPQNSLNLIHNYQHRPSVVSNKSNMYFVNTIIKK
jgi:hypothetical protein